jgi:hypothetical protein
MLTLVLLLGGFIPKFEVPFWVILACATAITLGILSGGWRIVRTLGFAIYRVRPLHALSSQLTSGLLILTASSSAHRYRPRTWSPPRSWASVIPNTHVPCAGRRRLTSPRPG